MPNKHLHPKKTKQNKTNNSEEALAEHSDDYLYLQQVRLRTRIPQYIYI